MPVGAAGVGQLLGIIPQQVSRASAEAVSAIVRVIERAFGKRKTAATDATVKAFPHTPHDADSLIQYLAERLTYSGPVALVRRAPVGQAFKRQFDLTERKSELLCDEHERESPYVRG